MTNLAKVLSELKSLQADFWTKLDNIDTCLTGMVNSLAALECKVTEVKQDVSSNPTPHAQSRRNTRRNRSHLQLGHIFFAKNPAIQDPSGSYTILSDNVLLKKFYLINVYGPNEDNPSFLKVNFFLCLPLRDLILLEEISIAPLIRCWTDPPKLMRLMCKLEKHWLTTWKN